ncbi:5'-nucleotidase C-terminal domain-containing protein [Ferrimonas pelagia]|uniref:5'-nucleotidase C-terminal domain-containing protein n=1 Tax=Ferrimonas pelagia TaxID=1177826 RepID=A0ABP9EXY8_9GAMM
MIEGQTLTTTPDVMIKSRGELSGDRQTITIGATGDMHGYIRAWDYAQHDASASTGFAKIQTALHDLRAEDPNLILIDLGDTVQGNSAELFNHYPTHPVVDAMNYMQYDVWVPGNHEFDFERSFIDRNLASFNGAIISSNIFWDLGDEAQEDIPYLRGHQIFDVHGATVAVIGVTPSLVPQWQASLPQNFRNLRFDDELASVSATVDHVLATYNPDVVIGAFHLGRQESGVGCGVNCIAHELGDKFDVIFMGHEHARFIEQTTVGGEVGVDISANGDNLAEDKRLAGVYNEAARATRVKVIEPGNWGWALAKAEIELERNAAGDWQLADTTLSNITMAEIEEDAQMVEMFDAVHSESIDDATTAIGTIEGNFTFSANGLADEATNTDVHNGQLYTTIHHAKVADMPLVDLIHHVQISKVEQALAEQGVKVDVSAASLFGDSSNLLDQQAYMKRHSADLYRYDNNLMAVQIRGDKLKDYMEWSYRYLQGWSEGDLTVAFDHNVRSYNYDLFDATIEYHVDLSQPVGQRVTITAIGQDKVAFEPSATYVLALNNYRYGILLAEQWLDPQTDHVLYDSGNDSVYAIRDMLTEFVASEYEQYGALKMEKFINQNWYLTQYGKPDAQGHIAEPGAILLARQDGGAGEALWQQLRTGQVCVAISGERPASITRPLNPADADTFFANDAFDLKRDMQQDPAYFAELFDFCRAAQ